MKFRIILFVAAFLFLNNLVHAQSIQVATGSYCVGSQTIFILAGGSCTYYNWSVSSGVNGVDYSITGSTSSGSLTVNWLKSFTASVGCSYTCNSSGGSAYSSNFTIGNKVTPSVSISSSLGTTACQGSSVTFTATPTNGGAGPYYNWKINGTTISSGSSNIFTRTNLVNGDIVSVGLTSNYSCLTASTATSNSITMSITLPSPVGVTITGPATICSASSTNASFVASVTNGGSSPVYTWLKNGNPVSDRSTSPPAYVYVPLTPLVNGDKIKCQVTSNASCVSGNPATSNEYTVVLTPSVTPTVSVQITKLYYCTGENISFTASSSYISGSSTYSWKLNGTQFATTNSTSLPVSTDVNAANTFSPGDIVTVDVTGLTGTCLTGTTATGTTNTIPFVITPLPTATINPNGTAIISSTGTPPISITASTGTSYQWKKDAVAISPGGTVNPYSANTAGTYNVVVTTNGCSKQSSSLIITKNIRPVANAGLDQTLVLPTRSTTLVGTGTDGDGNGTISVYTWRLLSSPSTANSAPLLSNPAIASPPISGLFKGDYEFGLIVTDIFGEQSIEDRVIIHVAEPPNNFNRIVETEVFVKDQLTEASVNALLIQDKKKSVSTKYFNGLGYPMQSVVTQGSPLLKDIVKPVVYDEYGRTKKNYLPVTINENTGYYKTNGDIIDATTGNYKGIALNFYSDSRPFSEASFESSPLNRPSSEYGAGSDWYADNKFIGYQYLINTHSVAAITLTGEKIVAWKISSSTGLPIRASAVTGYVEGNGYYSSNQLSIKSTKDEHGNEVREYTDKAGRVVLKKVQAVSTISSLNSNTEWAMTYYIYDDFGNLRFVLQPLLSALVLASNSFTPLQTDLDKGGFQYKYDASQRMIEKKVPGADVVYMVYDKLDRLVMTQDGNQRKEPGATTNTKTEWSFIKYDALNRPVITGIYVHSSVIDQVAMSGQISTANFYETYTGAAPHGYTSVVFPTTGQILTVTYYDNYKFRDDLAGTSAYSYTPGDITGQEAIENPDVIGLMTGSKTNILDGALTNYLWSVTYYDVKYRTIQVKAQNHKVGIDRVSNLYDFVRLKESKSTHNKGATSYSAHRKLDYDHVGRLTEIQHKFHTEPNFVILQKNIYNELGQLTTKKLHSRNSGSTFSQSIDYSYNIRGWLEKVNDPANPEASDLFSMDMRYNRPSSSGGTKQYNGNISEIVWKSAGLDKQSYGYKYDPMNRLLEAKYYNQVRPRDNNRYNELIGDGTALRPAYDLNGNIMNLFRNGKVNANTYGLIDDLKYAYVNSDNVLTSINDVQSDTNFDDGFKDAAEGSAEYSYDANGNLREDQNKGITSITYNFLNLPNQVQKGTTNYITYTYDAAGRKLKQQVFGSTPKTTDYVGEYVYENDVLQFVNHEEGRIISDISVGAPRPWEYQYFLKDHLGNVRVTFSEKKTNDEHIGAFEGTTPDPNEVGYFQNYSRSQFPLFNHTAGGTYSQLLTAGYSSKIGLAKSMSVNQGDVVDMEVYTKYEGAGTLPADPTTLFNALVSTFGLNSTGGTGIDGKGAYDAFNNANLFGGGVYVGRTVPYEDGAAPKAYLNYILFDETFMLIDFGFDQISINAKQVGVTPIVGHDYLSLHVKVQQKGYLYIYLSNEQTVQTNVYFDDMKITYNTGVEQVSDYYAFGLKQNSNGYERQGLLKNPHQFNGKEKQDELDLGWLDYGARFYDPTCGCWHSIDPHAENYLSTSPYVFALNNPVLLKDDNGKDIIITNLSESQQRQLSQFAKTNEGRAFLSQFAVQGREYNIGGEKFTFDVKETSGHNIFYQTADIGGYAGLTETYVWNPVKKEYVRAKDFGGDLKGAKAAGGSKSQYYNFSVFLDDGLSSDGALYTIGHESFVHVDQNRKELDKAFGDYKSGKLNQEAKASPLKNNSAENVLSSIMSTVEYGPTDHKLMVDGKVVNLQKFVKELDQIFKTTKFSEQYEKDRKRHKDNPNM